MNYGDNATQFTPVCKLTELPEGRGKAFIINEVELSLFRIGIKVFAVSNICPHLHTPVIHDGFLENGNVVCPAHGWAFSLETGKQPDGRRGLDKYDVEIREDVVFVKAIRRKFNF